MVLPQASNSPCRGYLQKTMKFISFNINYLVFVPFSSIGLKGLDLWIIAFCICISVFPAFFWICDCTNITSFNSDTQSLYPRFAPQGQLFFAAVNATHQNECLYPLLFYNQHNSFVLLWINMKKHSPCAALNQTQSNQTGRNTCTDFGDYITPIPPLGWLRPRIH